MAIAQVCVERREKASMNRPPIGRTGTSLDFETPPYVDLREARIWRRIFAEVPFCQDCGITNPPGGFYPMWIFHVTEDGESSLSSYLCHECEQKRRLK